MGCRFRSERIWSLFIRPKLRGPEAKALMYPLCGRKGRDTLFIAALCLMLSASAALGAPRRILYVTATYGFRHTDSIDASVEVMQQLARESGTLEIVHTEDVSLLTAAYLRSFDAVYFFTSGELPLSDQQKTDLLEFVRQGKGFGGSHSATDCLYTWPEYGDMIGGYFDGHPWAREAVGGSGGSAEPPGGASRRQVSASPKSFINSARFRAIRCGCSSRSTRIGEHDRRGNQPYRWRFPARLDSELREGPGVLQRLRAFPRQFPATADSHHAVEGAALAHGRNRCRCYAAVGCDGAVTFRRCRRRAGSLRRQWGVCTRQHRHHLRRQAYQWILFRCGRGRASVAVGGNACRGKWHRCAPVRCQARPSARRTP